jgi:ubiquinone/menaquinone biosynthesis C-methylase UbiE
LGLSAELSQISIVPGPDGIASLGSLLGGKVRIERLYLPKLNISRLSGGLMNLIDRFRNRAIRTPETAEEFWSTQQERKANWHDMYWEQTPSRHFLAQNIADLEGVNSVLEFGCNVGANLYAIHAVNPSISLGGFDLNQSAVNYGTQKFAKESIEVDMRVQNLKELSAIGPNSVDCCFSRAVLQHLPPESYEAAIKDMYRIARKYVVCLELHPFSEAERIFHAKQLQKKYGDRIQRNYWDEFKNLGASEENIRVLQVPPRFNPVEISDANALVIVTKK